jgi:2-polyprenyl-3-methyl-5-hydroxy-6-metoxy-1,4-benzoquinol methylase
MPCSCRNSSTEGAAKFFSKRAHSYLKRFRRRGLRKEQQLLVAGIPARTLQDATILEIGSGIGALHLTLVRDGAARATGVELSEEMLAGARDLADEMGVSNRVEYVQGDFVDISDRIDAADIVVLDKVVCCYENLGALLSKSIPKARRLYALVYPQDNVVVALGFFIVKTLANIFRWSFRPYRHDWNAMLRRVIANGFSELYRRETLLWTISVWEKV